MILYAHPDLSILSQFHGFIKFFKLLMDISGIHYVSSKSFFLLYISCSLQQVLLQSEEELMSKQTSELLTDGAAPKPKKMVGKMKVQG